MARIKNPVGALLTEMRLPLGSVRLLPASNGFPAMKLRHPF